MLSTILLFISLQLLVNGNGTGHRFPDHDPCDLLLTGFMCAEEYLEELVSKEHCLDYREYMNKSKDLLHGFVFQDDGTFNVALPKVNESLEEPNVLRRMREALFIMEEDNGIHLEMVCNLGLFPHTTMLELVRFYNNSVWSEIQPMAMRDNILKIIFDRLDQLSAMEAFCGRINGKDKQYLKEIKDILWNFKDGIKLAYDEVKGTDHYLKQGYIKKVNYDVDISSSRSSSNSRSGSGSRSRSSGSSSSGSSSRSNKGSSGSSSISSSGASASSQSSPSSSNQNDKTQNSNNEASNNKEADQQSLTALPQFDPSSKEGQIRQKLFENIEKAFNNIDYNKLPATIKTAYEALKQYFNGKDMTTAQIIDMGKIGLGLVNFAGSIIPLPYIGAIVNMITGVLGVVLELARPEVKSEVQILHESMLLEFAKVIDLMNKQHDELIREIHETTLTELVLLPGTTILNSMQAFMKFNDQQNILNVCNSMTKNNLFSAIRSYLISGDKGYFARTLRKHGNLLMFEQVANVTKIYMLTAIQAEIICEGIKKYSSGNYTFEPYVSGEDNVTPFTKWMTDEYNNLTKKIDEFRYAVELNAVRKAADYVKYKLSTFESNNVTEQKEMTYNLTREVNQLWSVSFEFFIIWGKNLRFVISGVAYTDEQAEYEFENAILNTENEEKSFAVIRRLWNKTVEVHKNPLNKFLPRWDFYRKKKAELNRYMFDTIVDLLQAYLLIHSPLGAAVSVALGELRPGITSALDDRYMEKMQNEFVKKGISDGPSSLSNETAVALSNVTHGLQTALMPVVRGRVKKSSIGWDPSSWGDEITGALANVTKELEGAVIPVTTAADEAKGKVKGAIDDAGTTLESVGDVQEKMRAFKDQFIKEAFTSLIDGTATGILGDLLKSLGLKDGLKSILKLLPKMGFKFEEIIVEVPKEVDPKFKGMTFFMFEEEGGNIMMEDTFEKGNYGLLYAWGKSMHSCGSKNFTVYRKIVKGTPAKNMPTDKDLNMYYLGVEF